MLLRLGGWSLKIHSLYVHIYEVMISVTGHMSGSEALKMTCTEVTEIKDG